MAQIKEVCSFVVCLLKWLIDWFILNVYISLIDGGVTSQTSPVVSGHWCEGKFLFEMRHNINCNVLKQLTILSYLCSLPVVFFSMVLQELEKL